MPPRAVVGERDDEPVLGLDHLGRRIEPSPSGWPRKSVTVTNRSSGWPRRQQPLVAAARRHRIERVEDQVREALAPERRLEPARADELRQLGLDLVARGGFDGLVDLVLLRCCAIQAIGIAQILAKRCRRGLLRVEQRLDIGMSIHRSVSGSSDWPVAIACARNTPLIPPALAPATISTITRSADPAFSLISASSS